MKTIMNNETKCFLDDLKKCHSTETEIRPFTNTQMTFVSSPKRKIKSVRDTFRAYLTEGARYTDNGEQYPIIEEWMIPKKMEDVCNAVPIDKIKRIHDIENWYVCPYCCDDKLLSVLNNPWRYVNKLRRSRALMGFDLSPHSDMPFHIQKRQMYDNLAVTYFFGKRHVKVIPNVRYGCLRVADDYLEAFPRHCLISIGSYGCVNSIQEKRVFYGFLSKILPVLQPSGVAVYGSTPEDVFGEFEDDFTFYPMQPYIKRVPFKMNRRKQA